MVEQVSLYAKLGEKSVYRIQMGYHEQLIEQMARLRPLFPEAEFRVGWGESVCGGRAAFESDYWHKYG
jgi:hypothetical protein